jgi:outer membrane protein
MQKMARSKAWWGVGAAALVIVAGVAALPSSQTTPSFAYVSTDIVLQNTPGYLQADSTWRAELSGWREEIQQLSRRYDSLSSALDQQSIVLTPTSRQEKVDEIQSLGQRLQQRQTELQQRAEERRSELIQPLEDRIQGVIDGIRAERNLSVIFDVAAPGNNIISADQRLDLTRLVVQRLSASGGP